MAIKIRILGSVKIGKKSKPFEIGSLVDVEDDIAKELVLKKAASFVEENSVTEVISIDNTESNVSSISESNAEIESGPDLSNAQISGVGDGYELLEIPGMTEELLDTLVSCDITTVDCLKTFTAAGLSKATGITKANAKKIVDAVKIV